jgi:hypothetical protein
MPPILHAPLSDVAYLIAVLCLMVGPGYIATHYQLDGPKIESRWGESFPTPVQTGPGAHPDSYTTGNESLFSEGKAVGAWHFPLTPSKCQG